MSITDCDTNSTIPQAGDNIVQLGNTTDTTRQGAIMLSSHGNDTPSITLYSGIGSDSTNVYSLANKEYVSFGVSSTNGKAYLKVYGNSYIGNRDGSQYIKYENGVVSVNGTLAVGTTLPDGTTLETAIENASTNYKKDEVFKKGIISESELEAIKTYIKAIEKDKADAIKNYQTLLSSGLFDKNIKTTSLLYTSDGKKFITADNKGFTSNKAYFLELNYNEYISEADKFIDLIENIIKDNEITEEEKEQINSEFEIYNKVYSDFTSCMLDCSNAIQASISRKADNAITELGGLDYLKKAFENQTVIKKGLILTSAINLGSKDEDGNWTVKSGISGIYDKNKKGGGLATYWGGGNIDMEDTTSDLLESSAKGAVRFDSSGYFAKGNISWDKDGHPTFKNKSDDEGDERSLTIQGNEIGLTNEKGQPSLQLDGNTVETLDELVNSSPSNVNFNFLNQNASISADIQDVPYKTIKRTVVLLDYSECGVTSGKNYSVIIPQLQITSTLNAIANFPNYSSANIDYHIEILKEGETVGTDIFAKSYFCDNEGINIKHTDTTNNTTIYTNKRYRVVFRYILEAYTEGENDAVSNASITLSKVSASSVIVVSEISKLTRIYGNGLIVKQAANKYFNVGTFTDSSKLINAKDVDDKGTIYSLDMAYTFIKNGNSWCKKWNNGFLECGGYVTWSSGDSVNVSFPHDFASNSDVFNIQVNGIRSSTAGAGSNFISSYTKSGFVAITESSATPKKLFWTASGFWKTLES